MGRKWWKKAKRKKQKAKAQQIMAQPVTTGRNATTSYSMPACHEGVIGVFGKDNLKFWGGKSRDVHMYNDWDLVLCFSDRDSQWENNDPSPLCTSNEQARRLLSPELFMFQQRAPYIGLDWPDYGCPDFGRAWWDTLLGDLKKIEKDGDINVALCCTGGHGRTGSALAILHSLCWPNAYEDPVTMIRRIYCHNCVESASQINYIQNVIDREIKAKPAWSSTGTRTASSSGYYSQYEIGDRQPQGSAAATKLAEIETAAALNRDKDYVSIVEKAIDKRLQEAADYDGEEVWQQEDFIPFGADQMKHGHIYTPIQNAAGDIIGWKERKDVAI